MGVCARRGVRNCIRDVLREGGAVVSEKDPLFIHGMDVIMDILVAIVVGPFWLLFSAIGWIAERFGFKRVVD